MQRKRGFTLIEMVVTISVLGILLGFIYGTLIYQQRNANLQIEYTVFSQKLQSFIGFFKIKMREIGYDPFETNAYGIINGDSTVLRYNKDDNENGNFSDDSPHQFSFSSHKIYYDSNSLISDIDTFELTYYDFSNDSIPGIVQEVDTVNHTCSPVVRRVHYKITGGKTVFGKKISISYKGDVIVKNRGL